MKFVPVAALLFTALAASAQGPLTPPPGASPAVGPANALNGSGQPQATMKSLHQVEPRTPLAAGSPGVTVNANGGFSIAASGSYYLTGNLTVITGYGIAINANRVSLDLMGFTIEGITAVAASSDGVLIGASNSFVTVRNGQIRGNSTFSPTDGTTTGFGFLNGVHASLLNVGIVVSDLVVGGVRGTGINVDDGSVDRCTVTDCAIGISATIVRDCALANCCDGIISNGNGFISGCRVSVSGTNCEAVSAGSSVVQNCLVSASGGSASGIRSDFGDISNCRVNVTVASGAGIGIKAQNGLVAGCHVICSGGSGITGDGIDATNGIVNTCRIIANSSALKAAVADGCFITSGAGIPGSTTITNRYNMPATP